MCQAGRKARKWACHARDKKSVIAGEAKKNSSKMNEQCGNLYENKGPLWKTHSQAGMSMKTKLVSCQKPEYY
jgi:hypothetical protein